MKKNKEQNMAYTNGKPRNNIAANFRRGAKTAALAAAALAAVIFGAAVLSCTQPADETPPPVVPPVYEKWQLEAITINGGTDAQKTAFKEAWTDLVIDNPTGISMFKSKTSFDSIEVNLGSSYSNPVVNSKKLIVDIDTTNIEGGIADAINYIYDTSNGITYLKTKSGMFVCDVGAYLFFGSAGAPGGRKRNGARHLFTGRERRGAQWCQALVFAPGKS